MSSLQSGISAHEHKASKTAALAACIRAYHYRWSKSPVFADAYAVDMLPRALRFLVGNRLLSWFCVHLVFRTFRPVQTEVLLRARYAEDHLREAISSGVGQYVILGAGLDTFSTRHKEFADCVRIFELDHPATQATKEKKMRGVIPPNLVFVPIDFETDVLDEALARSDFDPQKPAFFSWLGTTYYLTEDAVWDTFERVARIAAPGSRIVFDYMLHKDMIPAQSLPAADKLDRFVARLGEPMLSVFAPEELNAEMSRIGFVEIETMLAEEQKSRYMTDRTDLVDPPPNFSFALFEVPADESEDEPGQPPPNDIEPVSPGGDVSKETPPDKPENPSPEPDSGPDNPKDPEPEPDPPPEPAEDPGNAPNSNADGDGASPKDNDRDEGADSQEDKRKKQKQRKKSQTPPKTGGRRNGPSKPLSSVNDDTKDKPTFTPRPELICRKPSWQWEVILSADDGCRIAKVLQNGERLDGANGEWRLSFFTDSLSIDYEDRKSEKLSLFDDTPMIFKLRKDWKGDGRKVRGVTSGYFIVIVPKEWKRTGNAPVEPEGCTDANFMAHFFYRKKGESDTGGFEDCDLLTTTGFELSGDRVFDNSDDGELFVGAPPKLRTAAGVVWARIGEERKDGWKGENFKPDEQSLADVLNSRQGRFFIRVYDDDPNLLDSGEFRYLRDLREIRVDGEPYSANTLLVPPSTGYSPAKVQFVSTDGTAIRPNLDTAGTHVTMQSGGLLRVAPHPEGDHISCALPSGSDHVDTVIKLPRIWWRMERSDGEADEWRDLPLSMTRQQFCEYADADEAIRLRLPLCVSSVKVGFDEELDRTYRPQKDGDNTETEIRLSDFIDYDQIDQRLNKDALLNVQCSAEVIALIRISADPVPTITTFTSEPTVMNIGQTATLHWTTQNAESDDVLVSISDGVDAVESSGSIMVEPVETTTYTLRLTAHGRDDVTKDAIVTVLTRPEKLFALVKRTGNGWRQGKGFSSGEIHATDLTVEEVSRRFIRVDTRRRSTHQVNIDTIKESMDD